MKRNMQPVLCIHASTWLGFNLKHKQGLIFTVLLFPHLTLIFHQPFDHCKHRCLRRIYAQTGIIVTNWNNRRNDLTESNENSKLCCISKEACL